jgi:hypothetical protein
MFSYLFVRTKPIFIHTSICRHVRNPAECLLKSLRRLCLSVRTHEITRERKKQILIKFDAGECYEKLSSHFNFHLDWTMLTTTLHKIINTCLGLFRYVQKYMYLSVCK